MQKKSQDPKLRTSCRDSSHTTKDTQRKVSQQTIEGLSIVMVLIPIQIAFGIILLLVKSFIN